MVPNNCTTLQVTSTFLVTFREKNIYGQALRIPKMSQKQSKLKVIIHVFGLSRGPSFERHGMNPRDMVGHWKRVMWLVTNMWMSFIYFETVLDFTRNEQMGCLEAFQGNTNSVKHLRNLTSHIGFPRNVWGEKWTLPRKVQKCLKNSQNQRL